MSLIVYFKIPVETEDEAQAMIDKVHEKLELPNLECWYEPKVNENS
jgi:hypothetical protein